LWSKKLRYHERHRDGNVSDMKMGGGATSDATLFPPLGKRGRIIKS
jgi:hypothetical protein